MLGASGRVAATVGAADYVIVGHSPRWQSSQGDFVLLGVERVAHRLRVAAWLRPVEDGAGGELVGRPGDGNVDGR
jgi:hypothetical protein